ncbi:hypothetical protein CANMA_003303 [Candida margitis]|uniref:uncharacterized protein n=1 Tax=Candida margitis TaxID=1775924 RepID=UPI002227CB3A|nr:uncharacterized protein CANMA_003303 [Candida margitis]KAI5966057.1 hypothetical protein CANMA_003303 [Candida margitis]
MPFTGFKIVRQYKISGYAPPISMHFLTIAHCSRGKVDYKKVLRTQTSNFVDWEVPFCLLKPKLSEQVVGMNQMSIQKHNRDINMITNKACSSNNSCSFSMRNCACSNVTQLESNSITESSSLNNVLHTIKYKTSKIKQLLRKKFDLTMEKLTNGNWVEYSGKNKNIKFESQQRSQQHRTSMAGEYNKFDGGNQQSQQSQSLSTISLHTALTQEINNLICYKMARRKKYAKRKISFFMPHTFVGGLYECLIPLDQKHQILESFLNESSINNLGSPSSPSASPFFMVSQNFQIKCDPHLSRPLAPLIAEDSTKQWFENKLHHVLNPKLIQTIPYLTTVPPSSLSTANMLFPSFNLLRFTPWQQQESSPDMNLHSWASKIEVNEEYNYDDVDLHVVSKMVAYSANLLNQLIAPLDFNWLVKSYNRANVNERDPASDSASSSPLEYGGEEIMLGNDDSNGEVVKTAEAKGASDGLSWDQKVSFWLATLNENYINRILLKIEDKWDKLNLD